MDYILAKNPGKPVNVLIDSTDGSLATALSISSAFKRHGDVSVHFVGMNASAATIASLGAKHVSIDTAAWYLVHKCSNEFFKWSSLNADQMADLIAALEKQKSDLDKLDAGVAAMYAAKCRKDPKALLDLMKVGGWLSAKEALEWGFVDEITDEPEDTAPRLTDATASAMAAAGMPIPNVPVADRESALGKFFAAIAAMFRPGAAATPEITNQTNTPDMSTIILPALCAALALDAVELSGDKATATLSVEQLAKIDKALTGNAADLKAKDTEIATLKSRISELEKKPAESTSLSSTTRASLTSPKIRWMPSPPRFAAPARSTTCCRKARARSSSLINQNSSTLCPTYSIQSKSPTPIMKGRLSLGKATFSLCRFSPVRKP